MIRSLFITLAIFLASMAQAATLIIPAAGSGEGRFQSRWETELTLHNAGADPAVFTLAFHNANGLVDSSDVLLNGKETLSLNDVVRERFGLESATGAILIDGEDLALRKLAVSTRIFTTEEGGQFGQDIPAFSPSQALGHGDTGVIPGPSDPAAFRFNLGVYALAESNLEWALIRSNGTEAETVTRSYVAGTQIQYSASTLFSVEPQPNDTIYARVADGNVLVYGSIIDNISNDPTWVPFSLTRENFAPEFIGLDINDDGQAELLDADHDGVLDSPVTIGTSYGFPAFFRVIASDPEGHPVTLSLMHTSGSARLIDDQGNVQWMAGSELRGTTGNLVLEATDGIDTVEFTIPANFR